jgi:hypothetical protein
MKDACKEIAKPGAGKLSRSLGYNNVPPPLGKVANAFVDLQQARHEADYDISRTFSRAETLDLVEIAERAFASWQTVRKTVPADVFLVALLAHKGMCR